MDHYKIIKEPHLESTHSNCELLQNFQIGSKFTTNLSKGIYQERYSLHRFQNDPRRKSRPVHRRQQLEYRPGGSLGLMEHGIAGLDLFRVGLDEFIQVLPAHPRGSIKLDRTNFTLLH